MFAWFRSLSVLVAAALVSSCTEAATIMTNTTQIHRCDHDDECPKYSLCVRESYQEFGTCQPIMRQRYLKGKDTSGKGKKGKKSSSSSSSKSSSSSSSSKKGKRAREGVIAEKPAADDINFIRDDLFCFTGSSDEVTALCRGRCCTNGACEFSRATICQGACLGGPFACVGLGASTKVGPGSCLGVNACFGLGSGQAVVVGANSCRGENACSFGRGDIGTNSCNASRACVAGKVVGDGQCNQPSQCSLSGLPSTSG